MWNSLRNPTDHWPQLDKSTKYLYHHPSDKNVFQMYMTTQYLDIKDG